MANFKIIGMTRQKCPRCLDLKQKTVYNKSKIPTVVCRNCGHSWEDKRR